MVENSRTILRAGISALPVERRRIMDGEKNFQEFSERDGLRIESNLNRLGMSGGFVTDLTIRWMWQVAARVTGLDLFHSAQVNKHCFETPEASSGEGGYFLVVI